MTILDATYLGDTIHYDVGTRWGQTLAVRQSSAMQGGEALAPGSAALLHWSRWTRIFSIWKLPIVPIIESRASGVTR